MSSGYGSLLYAVIDRSYKERRPDGDFLSVVIIAVGWIEVGHMYYNGIVVVDPS